MIEVQNKTWAWSAEYFWTPEASDVHYGGKWVARWVKHFKEFKDIPPLTRTAVAALSMCGDNEALAGYGRRVSRTTFWVDSTPAMVAEYKESKDVSTEDEFPRTTE